MRVHRCHLQTFPVDPHQDRPQLPHCDNTGRRPDTHRVGRSVDGQRRRSSVDGCGEFCDLAGDLGRSLVGQEVTRAVEDV